MDINAQILALGAEYEEFVIGARRCVHPYAEPAAREVRTRELILETAQQLEISEQNAAVRFHRAVNAARLLLKEDLV